MVTVFFSYSHRDEELRNELEIHLATLKRQGIIRAWHDRRISKLYQLAGVSMMCPTCFLSLRSK